MNTTTINEERAGAVDETLETLTAALNAFGFTQTGSAEVDGSSLYAKRAENSDRRYLGRVYDPTQTRRDCEEWFEANGASLPA